ncbi:NAD-dependent deacylase, partial [bacterium]|nr:NAD-dependent deacylase [bacterium]
MENIIDNEKVNRVAELIKESKYTVVLTGAGVSTGSGIADFRTPGKGIWEKVDPFKVTSIAAFKENPQRFYHFYRPRIEMLSR